MSKKRKVNWKKVLPKLLLNVLIYATLLSLLVWVVSSFFEINSMNRMPNPVYDDRNFFIVLENIGKFLNELF